MFWTLKGNILFGVHIAVTWAYTAEKNQGGQVKLSLTWEEYGENINCM